jgi:HEAT repeat protein
VLRDPHPQAVSVAANTLGRIGDTRAIDGLVDILAAVTDDRLGRDALVWRGWRQRRASPPAPGTP